MIKQVRVEAIPLYEVRFTRAEKIAEGYDIPDKLNIDTCLNCDRECKRGYCEKIKTRAARGGRKKARVMMANTNMEEK